MKVPFVDLSGQYQSVKKDVLKKIEEIISTGNFILGNDVKQLEEEFARYSGVKYGIGVANGTDALQLAILACDIKEGDEVITAANTFIATAAAISMSGAKPVLVDIDSDTYNMDPAKLEARITKRTKVIIPVHLCGRPVSMKPLLEIARRHNLKVIEDAAQAHGAKLDTGGRAGSAGDIACFSFYPAKNLGCYGDGGIVITNNGELADKIQLLRNYGQRAKNQHVLKGFNSRLDNLQAAILNIKLKRLDQWNQNRRNNGKLYQGFFNQSPQLDVQQVKLPNPKDGDHTYHLYVILAQRRDELAAWLKQRDIATGIHYPLPIHLQECYKDLGYSKGEFPMAEDYCSRTLSLPMYPELSKDQIKWVVNSVKAFYLNSA